MRWGSPGPGRIGRADRVATRAYCTWLACVPLEERIGEWTSEVTAEPDCRHPGRFAGLGVKQATAAAAGRLSAPAALPVCTVTHAGAAGPCMTGEPRAEGERRTAWRTLRVFTVLGGSSKNVWSVKAGVIFFFFNLVGVPPSVLITLVPV